MRKITKHLILNRETVRKLTGLELGIVHGGQVKLSGPPDVCKPPLSAGSTSCTGCDSINNGCATDGCQTIATNCEACP